MRLQMLMRKREGRLLMSPGEESLLIGLIELASLMLGLRGLSSLGAGRKLGSMTGFLRGLTAFCAMKLGGLTLMKLQ